MDSNKFHLEFPFTKIDREKRIVVGIATADNIDKSGDIVDYNASMDAFGRWIGNIREMHAPKAVGKALSYRGIDLVDDSGDMGKAIEVEAYISKGAEDTWQKVIDGTLKGFSIGGNIGEKKSEFHTRLNKMIRRITKYDLGELSLVDNPCNPVAYISVVKSHDDKLVYELNKQDKYDIYYCDKCGVATFDDTICSICSKEMYAVGSVVDFTPESVSKIIENYLEKSGVNEDEDKTAEEIAVKGGGDVDDLQKNENDDTIANMTEGNGSNVAVDIVKQIASSMVPQFNIFTSTSGSDIAPLTYTSTGTTTHVEKSEEDSSEEDVEGGEEVNTEDLLKNLSEMMDTKLNDFKSEIEAAVDEKIDAVSKATEISEADAETDSLDETSDAEVDEKDEVIKRLTERIDALESSKATKKSIDDDSDNDDEEKIVKNSSSVWDGFFLPNEVVTALGYES